MKIIGRKKEKRVLEDALYSKSPEFIAVYGRRRVGKTFLIREFFHDRFAFQLTGAADEELRVQLEYFNIALKKYGGADLGEARNWIGAFEKLIRLLDRTKTKEQGKRIVFIDELSWLDTRRSGFLSALEHFWNTWGASHPDFILIICGSASSWIVNHVFKNRKGLHNRVTQRIYLAPFTLSECSDFFLEKDIDYGHRHAADSYMVFGGIPYYLGFFKPGLSVPQNVDAICFGENAPLKDEFEELYASLFKHSEKHRSVVAALASKRKGLTREEIIAETGLSSGGGLTALLDELEQSGFIRCYMDFSGAAAQYLYQLVDFFSLFYLKFMSGRKQRDTHFWSNFRGNDAWSGYAFEMLCLLHIDEIKDRLGILGVSAEVSAWRGRAPGPKLQIDLVIDRNDGVVNLCEMKYSDGEYVIDKAYAEKLTSRKEAFIQGTGTKKAVHLVMVTAAGLKRNAHSHIIQNALTLDDLWAR
jgi:hypothetical protein